MSADVFWWMQTILSLFYVFQGILNCGPISALKELERDFGLYDVDGRGEISLPHAEECMSSTIQIEHISGIH